MQAIGDFNIGDAVRVRAFGRFWPKKHQPHTVVAKRIYKHSKQIDLKRDCDGVIQTWSWRKRTENFQIMAHKNRSPFFFEKAE